MTEEKFLELVEEAVLGVPDEFASYMENIRISVEQYPSLELLKDMELPATQTLLGVYRGVPFNKRRRSWSPLLPDEIVIFQQPIERICGGNPEKIRDQIRRTVVHEIGHYFGISEQRMRDLDY